MFTQFAVATPKQAKYLREVKDAGTRRHVFLSDFPYIDKGWIDRDTASGRGVQLTSAGRVALELREILGPDRNLTKAQAGALWKYGWTPSLRRKLITLGFIGTDDDLTEDGEKIRHVLIKYGVSL